jgi:hypothetical protein
MYLYPNIIFKKNVFALRLGREEPNLVRQQMFVIYDRIIMKVHQQNVRK